MNVKKSPRNLQVRRSNPLLHRLKASGILWNFAVAGKMKNLDTLVANRKIIIKLWQPARRIYRNFGDQRHENHQNFVPANESKLTDLPI